MPERPGNNTTSPTTERRKPYTYTDELGRTITRYPPGWAEGAEPGCTTLPRGHVEMEE